MQANTEQVQGPNYWEHAEKKLGEQCRRMGRKHVGTKEGTSGSTVCPDWLLEKEHSPDPKVSGLARSS